MKEIKAHREYLKRRLKALNKDYDKFMKVYRLKRVKLIHAINERGAA